MAFASSLVIQKIPPEMAVQGIKTYGFGLTVVEIGISLLGAAFGFSHKEPIGSPVAGAFKSADVNKALCEINGVPISFLPVRAQPSKIKGQNPGGQMLDLDPVRDQKPSVVGDEVKVPSLRLLIPTNELISGLDLPGSACPGKTGHHLAADVGQVSEMLAHQFGQSQIMVMVNQIVPQIVAFRLEQFNARPIIFSY
jgi:hypothetical protein